MKQFEENKIIKKTVYSALFAALTFVVTVSVHIHIHLPGVPGYVNLGDCIVIISGILLGPLYGGFAAGIGSALADGLYGHWFYSPMTFLVKMLMAVVAYYIYNALSKHKDDYHYFPLVVSSLCAEVVMIAGYFVYEGFLYTFAVSAAGAFFNVVQGVIGVVLTTLMLVIMKKTKVVEMIKF